MKVEIKKLDSQGRIVLPLSWRKRIKSDEMVIVERDDRIEIFPREVDLSKYIDAIEVDVEKFEDYHELRRELREKG